MGCKAIGTSEASPEVYYIVRTPSIPNQKVRPKSILSRCITTNSSTRVSTRRQEEKFTSQYVFLLAKRKRWIGGLLENLKRSVYGWDFMDQVSPNNFIQHDQKCLYWCPPLCFAFLLIRWLASGRKRNSCVSNGSKTDDERTRKRYSSLVVLLDEPHYWKDSRFVALTFEFPLLRSILISIRKWWLMRLVTQTLSRFTLT